jgi:uncharacterized protein (DUF934 family)
MTLIRFRTDSVHEEPQVTLDAFLSQPDATAVRLESGEDARALLPFLDRLQLIEIAIPKFRDGRGYSSAAILREAGYTGELRAQGDVLIDQVIFLRRCGFDALASETPLDEEAVTATLARYPEYYQRAIADAAIGAQRPVWALRHG